MDKYYHFTSYNNFYKVINEGLVPQTGIRCQSIGDNRCGVFLSKGIDQSIVMFVYMYNFYKKYCGAEGDKILNEYPIEIQQLDKSANSISERLYNKMKIEQLSREIDRVKLIRSYQDFKQYIGGDGCFLAIDGIKCVDESNPSDCLFEGIIPPSNISLVNIKNKYNNSLVSSTDFVLSYFMSLYPLETINNSVVDEVKNSLYELYRMRNTPYLSSFNSYNYELTEIPISYYNQEIPKVKTLS